jgi:hypothetical protein
MTMTLWSERCSVVNGRRKSVAQRESERGRGEDEGKIQAGHGVLSGVWCLGPPKGDLEWWSQWVAAEDDRAPSSLHVTCLRQRQPRPDASSCECLGLPVFCVHRGCCVCSVEPRLEAETPSCTASAPSSSKAVHSSL